MTRPNTTGLLSLAFLGAIVATLCDANHVFTHTLSYPSPFVAGQAWWVFPGIFLAVIMGIGGMLAEGLMSHFGQVTYRHVDFSTCLSGWADCTCTAPLPCVRACAFLSITERARSSNREDIDIFSI